MEVQEALRASGAGLRLRLTLPMRRTVAASKPPRLLYLGLIILLILQLRTLHALVALAHCEAWARMAAGGWLCRVVLVLNWLMRRRLGTHLHCGREEWLATREGDVAGLELSHARTHISAHARHVLGHWNVVVVLRHQESTL